jgi:hypothetical protein
MRRKGLLIGFVLLCFGGLLTRGYWTPSIGWHLVCTSEPNRPASVDLILVENFDPNYRLFEQAAILQGTGLASRVLVPVQALGRESDLTNPVSRGIAELMAGFARVQNPEILPIQEIEPYTLNAAYQIRHLLVKEQLRSVLFIVPALRSRRSSLIYRAVFGAAGIQTHCLPVFDDHTPANWTTTWHGIQVVAEQSIKLQYYRLYLLRAYLGRPVWDMRGAKRRRPGNEHTS